MRMTPTAARSARSTVLQTAVAADARCASGGVGGVGVGTDLFFRADDAPPTLWAAQREGALRFCGGCPVRAACEELALRAGDGERAAEDMVRGGRTGQQLAVDREIRQAGRLAAVAAAGRDTEWEELVTLTVAAREEAAKNPDRRSGGPRRSGLAQAAQNDRVRHLADQARAIRTARRARTGWGAAA
ncbi:WhiB family transcriptional regulator [Streptomyces sp. NPDC055025]